MKKKICFLACFLGIWIGCDKNANNSQNINPPKGTDTYIFQGYLREIHTQVPGQEWENFIVCIFEVSDSLESPAAKETRINVVITKPSVPDSFFKTALPSDALKIGQIYQITVSLSLPDSWDMLSSLYNWKVLGLVAGLEIEATGKIGKKTAE